MNLDFTQTADAQEVRFRCPHCQKLYCTQNDVFEGADPLFDCVSCKKSFLLSRDVDSFGLFMTDTSNRTQFAECPKCFQLKPIKGDECPSCGVLISKFEEVQKAESPELFELSKMWQRVLADFTFEQAHQKFINACHQKMALNFAFKKYSEIKNMVGYDLACDHYMKQVELRLEQQFKAEEASYYSSVSRKLLSRAQTVFLCMGIFGVSILIFNKVRPTFPNLTGLVVAITVLSFGLVFIAGNKYHVKLED